MQMHLFSGHWVGWAHLCSYPMGLVTWHPGSLQGGSEALLSGQFALQIALSFSLISAYIGEKQCKEKEERVCHMGT